MKADCFGSFRNSSVCFGCFDTGSKHRNKPKKKIFGFTKQTETNAKQILFRFVSVRTEKFFFSFRGHPSFSSPIAAYDKSCSENRLYTGENPQMEEDGIEIFIAAFGKVFRISVFKENFIFIYLFIKAG